MRLGRCPIWEGLVLILCFLLFIRVDCSAGDLDQNYASCTFNCERQLCQNSSPSSSSLDRMPFDLGWIDWNCEERCEYDCMQKITDYRELVGYRPLKYFGHWPCRRYFGLEEPASCFFSLLNLFPHLLYLVEVLFLSRHRYPMCGWVAGYAVASVNAWLASTCYHAKKTALSTSYDLISALLLLCYGLLLVCVKVEKLLWRPRQRFRPAAALGLLALLAVFLSQRIPAMLQDEISFTMHMQTCFILVFLATVAWVGYIVLQWTSRRAAGHAAARWSILVQLWFLSAALLEVFDFPPIWKVLDAHALWHAATFPLGFVWYFFWAADGLDDILEKQEIEYQRSKKRE